MHNNYHFIKHLGPALHKKLSGATLVEAFSQNKDELIIGLDASANDFYIKADFNPSFSCLSFPESFSRARKNSIDLFKELYQKQVTAVTCFDNNRAFSIHLEQGFEMVFKLYGNRSNIILFKDESVQYIFKNSLKNDLETDYSSLNQEIDLSFEAFAACHGNLKKFDPTLGKPIADYLSSQQFEQQDIETKWRMLSTVYAALSEPNFYVTSSPMALHSLPPAQPYQSFDDPIEALNTFYFQYIRNFHFDRQKSKLLQALKEKYKSTKNYITKTGSKLKALQEDAKYNELADIIMANLHQIPANTKKVTLFDFYHNSDIDIKLNKNLSPQKNAEQYYRKAKNQKIELKKLTENLDNKEMQLLELEEDIEAIESTTNLKELKPWLKKEQQTSTVKDNAASSPYLLFEKDGFEILVGKNASKNDILTFKTAHKNDLWLHVKDATGSHVIIRQKGNHFPKGVIEYAASLAAWYSKRKSEGICPVTFTPRKYIRKPKGAPAGAVIIEKEEVVLVPPQKPC